MLTSFPQILTIAALNGLEIEVPEFEFGVDNHSPEYLAKFLYGKVPTFESADGSFTLTEGQAIARYIAESGPMASQLLGADPQTRAKIEEWACFSEQELAANVSPPLLMIIYNLMPYHQGTYDMAGVKFERALKKVEMALEGGKKFIVGDQLTLADLQVFSILYLATKYWADEEMMKSAPSVEGYMRGLLAEVPELRENFRELTFCKKRITKE